MSGDVVDDYRRLLAAFRPTADGWDAFVREALVERWIEEYHRATAWTPGVLEISLVPLTYLFDAVSTTAQTGAGDDRLIAVWGRSQAAGERDAARQAGFIPSPAVWSGAARDRGHFVAHAAGGGLDLNLFPQATRLNRGWSAQGRRWRAMERHAASHPGTPLFVRPSYRGPTWEPATIDYGLLVGDRLWCERFDNLPES